MRNSLQYPDDFELKPDTAVWREGTVYVQIEKVVQGHQVVSVEEQQQWNRTAAGWFIAR